MKPNEDVEDYDVDVEECPSLIGSEDTPKEEFKLPSKIQRTETIGLGEITVHGGWKKVTGGDTDFSGLASEFMASPKKKQPL